MKPKYKVNTDDPPLSDSSKTSESLKSSCLGELRNVALEENGEDKMVRESD